MKIKLIITVLLVAAMAIASYAQKLSIDKISCNAFVSNGFYRIDKLYFAGYENKGDKITYGGNISVSINRFKISTGASYTLQNFYIELDGNGTYASPPIVMKPMGYLDIPVIGSWKFCALQSIQIYGSIGFTTGVLIVGRDEVQGIYKVKDNTHPTPYRFPDKQFDNTVFGGLMALEINIPIYKRLALNIQPMWRQYFSQLDLYYNFVEPKRANLNTYNLLVGINYDIYRKANK